jgi:aspartate-semialdehyde dehydrogenase
MIKLAIVGATGAVGREVLGLLALRRFPLEPGSLRVFASSRSAGMKIGFRGTDYVVEDLATANFAGIDVVIFDTPDEVAAQYVPVARDAGCIVIDNSAAFRQDDDVPLVVPEINAHALSSHKGIIANPNCTTAIGVMALWYLHLAFGLESVTGATYQAVSGAGAPGIAQLERETHEYVRGRQTHDGTTPAFPYPILGNVIPQIGSFGPDGYTSEELKFEREGRKIMGLPKFMASMTCVRVAVVRSHCLALTASFRQSVSVEKAREALRSAPGISLRDDPRAGVYPMPITVSSSFDCEVGRIRMVHGRENELQFFVAGDQLWKGAALNAVQIAELLPK